MLALRNIRVNPVRQDIDHYQPVFELFNKSYFARKYPTGRDHSKYINAAAQLRSIKRHQMKTSRYILIQNSPDLLAGGIKYTIFNFHGFRYRESYLRMN